MWSWLQLDAKPIPPMTDALEDGGGPTAFRISEFFTDE